MEENNTYETKKCNKCGFDMYAGNPANTCGYCRGVIEANIEHARAQKAQAKAKREAQDTAKKVMTGRFNSLSVAFKKAGAK